VDEAAVRAFAKRFFDAIEQGDVDAVADCYTSDVEVWHNHDGLTQSRDENLAVLRGLVERIGERRYEDRRVEVFSGGFLQQHVLSGVRKDGQRVSLPAALICRLRDGRIARLDEYLDSAHVARFRSGA